MNTRRIVVILSRFLAFVAITQAVAFWIFCRSISTPVERHYRSAYFWISLPVVGPSTVEVRLIWKTGRHRKRQLATDNDAVDSDDGTGMVLSQSARNAGWTSLMEGPPQQVPTDALRPDLASLVFDGQSLWDLLLLPELSAVAALCASLSTWFLVMGLFRALPADLAWRRRYFAVEELFLSFFEESAALARKAHSGFKPLRWSAVRRIATHSAAPRTSIEQTQQPAPTVSFALPLFGVYSRTGQAYLWAESDAIE